MVILDSKYPIKHFKINHLEVKADLDRIAVDEVAVLNTDLTPGTTQFLKNTFKNKHITTVCSIDNCLFIEKDYSFVKHNFNFSSVSTILNSTEIELLRLLTGLKDASAFVSKCAMGDLKAFDPPKVSKEESDLTLRRLELLIGHYGSNKMHMFVKDVYLLYKALSI